jgi:hypothetical protein
MTRAAGGVLPALALLALVACRRPSQPYLEAAPSPGDSNRYAFSANPHHLDIRGTFAIVDGAVSLQVPGGDCRVPPYTTTVGNLEYMRFNCAGVSGVTSLQFRISLRNPLYDSRWEATYNVVRTRRVCTRQGIDRLGRPFCVRFTDETYEAVETGNGRLIVKARERS